MLPGAYRMCRRPHEVAQEPSRCRVEEAGTAAGQARRPAAGRAAANTVANTAVWASARRHAGHSWSRAEEASAEAGKAQAASDEPGGGRLGSDGVGVHGNVGVRPENGNVSVRPETRGALEVQS